mmetsp:Transcript_75957/g.180637  ORF Transcript_75957/g.180637 Transcript_75957/m.180637 type:complete len:120 (+) Transcript_75957:659-1018(+)
MALPGFSWEVVVATGMRGFARPCSFHKVAAMDSHLPGPQSHEKDIARNSEVAGLVAKCAWKAASANLASLNSQAAALGEASTVERQADLGSPLHDLEGTSCCHQIAECMACVFGKTDVP